MLYTMVAAGFLLLVMTVFGENGIVRLRSLARDREVLEQKIAAVERDSESIQRRLRVLREGKASYEKAAREQLGLVKPGEIVYDFRPDPIAERR